MKKIDEGLYEQRILYWMPLNDGIFRLACEINAYEMCSEGEVFIYPDDHQEAWDSSRQWLYEDEKEFYDMCYFASRMGYSVIRISDI